MRCGDGGGVVACPPGGDGGPPGGGGGPPGKERLPDVVDVIEEEEEEEEEAEEEEEGIPGSDASWLAYAEGKKIGRVWVKRRGAQGCMHCGEDAYIATCLGHQCQVRNQALHNTCMRVVVWPRARNRMSKGVKQREFLGRSNMRGPASHMFANGGYASETSQIRC